MAEERCNRCGRVLDVEKYGLHNSSWCRRLSVGEHSVPNLVRTVGELRSERDELRKKLEVTELQLGDAKKLIEERMKFNRTYAAPFPLMDPERNAALRVVSVLGDVPAMWPGRKTLDLRICYGCGKEASMEQGVIRCQICSSRKVVIIPDLVDNTHVEEETSEGGDGDAE